jgi:uncharacterized protein YbjT (DUF2867 family)
MKVVVVGGTGLIGSRLVAMLREHQHEAVAAAPGTGVNTITTEGLAAALTGADVVVDVSNSPSFEADAVLRFFTTSTRNVLAAAREAGVRHYVALSVVGTDRLQESGYFRGKLAQEELIRSGPIPWSIVRATQFFEFVNGIADAGTSGNVVSLSSALIQPMAADDVARAVYRIAVGAPVNGMVEVAGPQQFGLDARIGSALSVQGDRRRVVTDPESRYFGAVLQERTLLPDDGASLSPTRFEDWLATQEGETRTPVPQYNRPDTH